MKQPLHELVENALRAMREDGELALEELPGIVVERARDPRHGDFATPGRPRTCEDARPQAARHSGAPRREAVGHRAVRAGRGRRSRLRELPPLGGGPAGRGVAGIGRGRGVRPLRAGRWPACPGGVRLLQSHRPAPRRPRPQRGVRSGAREPARRRRLRRATRVLRQRHRPADGHAGALRVAALPRAPGRASHSSRPGLPGRLSPRDCGRPGGGARRCLRASRHGRRAARGRLGRRRAPLERPH